MNKLNDDFLGEPARPCSDAEIDYSDAPSLGPDYVVVKRQHGESLRNLHERLTAASKGADRNGGKINEERKRA